jgi:glycosyltransferase involved in cell wall biosynthesis
MDVLYDHQMFCIQRFGGISRVFIELMRELAGRPDCRIHWHRGAHIDEYDVSDFSGRLGNYLSMDRPAEAVESANVDSFRGFSRTLGRPFDIYHPSYYDASLIDVAGARKLAVTVHDMIPEKYFLGIERFKKLLDDKKTYVERADLVFVNSKSTRSDLVEILKADPAKVRVTYWASRMPDVDAAALPEARRQRPYFLYVGTRSKYKNFDVLMRAFAVSPWLRENFQVVCFGGTGDFLEHELKFFSENGMAGNFVYMSGDDSLLKALYTGATALVYTSRYEGFGLPLLEAMGCACPVVCCNTSSIPEVAGEAASFFDPDSPEELSSRMREVAEDDVKRAGMTGAGLERAKLFSWKRAAEETLAGYRSIL